MATCKPWDIVKVPFPYTDRAVRQSRPALVVSVNSHLLWVLMITSAENRGWPGDVEITDLTGTGLPAPSLVRTAKIATIDARDADVIGSLPQTFRAAVADRLRQALPIR